MNLLMNSDPKTFKPYLIDLFKDQNTNQDLMVDINTKKNDDYETRGLIVQTQKVKIYIKLQINDKEELRNFVSRLLYYVILMNNFRSKVDWDAIENVIESDFLTTH